VFLLLSLSLAVDYSFLMVHEVSPAGIPFNPMSAQGSTASSVGIGPSIGNSVNITGNLEISENNVVNLVGPSPSLPVTVYLNGSVDIVGNGTLVLKYATLYLVGAKSPYDRYVRLSNSTNGHPKLAVVNSSIATLPTTTIVRGRRHTVSYGFSVYAYDNSEINAVGLTLSSFGNQTSIRVHGEASVSLTNVEVDSVFAYDGAQVSIYTGTGQTTGKGIGFEGHNTSKVNLSAVTFENITASDDAHMILTHCTQRTGVVIAARDRARVDILAGTTLTNSQNSPPAPAIPSLFPAINASGYSYVSLSSSQIAAAYTTYPIVFLNDHATFAVTENGVIDSGLIHASDYSRVVLNNTNNVLGLTNIVLECYNSSSVYVFNSTLISRPFLVQINLFDTSSLSLVDSTISGGVIKLFDSAAFYASNSTLRSSSVAGGFGLRMVSQGNSRLTFIASQIYVYSLELKDDSMLSMESSVAWTVYCLSSSKVSLVGGEVEELSVSDSSRVYVMNSTLDELSLAYSDVTGSYTGLASFFENSNFTLSGGTLVSVANTTIKALSFSFSGHSNVIISNSTICNLSLQGSSIATLNTTSVQGSVYVTGDSKVLAYTPLRVRCVDYFGNPLGGSVVTITTGYVGAPIVLKQQNADENGLTEFTLFSEMDNATGSFPFGMVEVRGSYGGVRTSQDVSLGLTSKDVTLSFPLPSWSVYILPLVVFVLIVVLLATTYYILRRVRRKRD
jgi:hypothetical protein